MLSSLLLPLARHRRLLDQLEKYVWARDAEAKFPSTINPTVDSSAFAVRYQKAAPSAMRAWQDMEDVRSEILKRCQENQARKRKEVEEKKLKHQELLETAEAKQDQAARLSCLYTDCWNSYEERWEARHSASCRRCSLVKEAENIQLEAASIEVGFYEKLLPDNEELQRGIVYDLRIPELLALQRDAVLMLAEACVPKDLTHDTSFSSSWREEDTLQQWQIKMVMISELGATTKKHQGIRHVLEHPTFIVPNRRDVCLLLRGKRINHPLAWCVRSLTCLKTTDEHFRALQPFISSWEHDENMVIASKANAHPALHLLEFEAYGTLRAGCGLQLPRLLRAIEQRTLSFQRQGVLDLLMALLWQVGPPRRQKVDRLDLSQTEDWLRHSLQQVEQADFAERLCHHVSRLLRHSEDNWSNDKVLLGICQIARCIVEHSTSGAPAAQALLLEARQVALRWLRDVQRVMSGTESAEVVKGLRMKLVDIAATAALTFHGTGSAAISDSSLKDWLTARATAYDNILLSTTQVKNMEPCRKQLLYQARRNALDLEDQLHQVISDGQTLSAWLLEHWSDSQGGQLGHWERYEAPAERWYKVSFHREDESLIQVDVLEGAFLVNGRPVGRLPSQISQSDVYARLFRDSVFDVQPAHHGEGFKTMRVSGAMFGFFVDEDGDVIITEEREIAGQLVKATLVPHEAFQDDLPISLIEDHSHWLVEEDGKAFVYFRPVRFDDKEFTKGCSFEGSSYVLDLTSRNIIQTQEKWELIDVRSGTFEELFRVFSRLEDPGRIHVFHRHGEDTVAFLPRLQNLCFSIHSGNMSDIRITSRDFGGDVAEDQNLGTLIGLQRGLLLQTNHEKKLLMPHAEVVRELSCIVDLNMSQLRTPPVFAYTLRTDLRELRGPKDRVAWLYLAKLHALTAHLLRDPFTTRTGTETALSLLRSARCRGNLSNGEDVPSIVAEQTLQEIARLAPVRNSKKSAETVDFQQFPALCAHEGLAFLARDAMQEIQEQKALMGLASNGCPKDCEERCGRLAQRSYFRTGDTFGLAARLQAEEERSAAQPSRPWQPTCWQEQFGATAGARDVAFVVFANSLPPPENRPSLQSLLLTSRDLQGCVDFHCEEVSVAEWELLSRQKTLDLRQMWIAFFQAAKRPGKEKCGFMLAYFASQWPPEAVNHLQLLASISVRQESFRGLDPPMYASYSRPDEKDLNAATVGGIIAEHLKSFTESPPLRRTRREQEEADAQFQQRREEHQRYAEESIQRLAGRVALRWREGLRALEVSDCQDDMVSNAHDLTVALNECFERWWRAFELHEFLVKVERQLQGLGQGELSQSRLMERSPAPVVCKNSFNLSEPAPLELSGSPLDELWMTGSPGEQLVLEPPFQPPARRCPELRLVPETAYSVIHEELCAPLQESWRLAHQMKMSHISHDYSPPNLREQLEEALELRQDDTEDTWQRVIDALCSPGRFDALMRSCGLFEEPIPLSVLPRLPIVTGQLQQVIGSYAIALRAEQRVLRCLRLLELPHMSAWLARELQESSSGCVGWKPREEPGWLLLEIDNDFCIREQQAAVAKELISASGNQLLQLNMGEGKTSVIVPMLVASLANGNYLLRITVLSSLRPANAADWQLKLGGLLNRRLHPLFCRRDLPVSEASAQRMVTLLDKIRNGQHVLVTVPEHRLSMENKAIELAWKGELAASQQLHHVLDFFKRHGRDILDESDEILHAKYQLIYTLGQPVALDGGAMRWRAATAVLACVARHAPDLAREFGPKALQPVPEDTAEYEFPESLRLLAGANEQGTDGISCYQRLCKCIMQDFLDEVTGFKLPLRAVERTRFEECVLKPEAEDQPWADLHESLQPLAQLLRGILSHEVLLLVLSKRHRVDYGAHPQGVRRMAVPYRAKDVAAERAEFGHPDVAMLLSILTYYRSGLSDDYLHEVFERLRKKAVEAEAASIYEKWTAQMKERMPADLRKWSGVNLDNRQMVLHRLFPLLRRHRGVIDFWLDEVVFPVEAKCFPQKIASTAWDLCSDHGITTGFSGTDDTRLLLPLTIEQKNLPGLACTNGIVLRNLLKQENDRYTSLPAEVSPNGQSLLQLISICQRSINVVLDAGAWVTDMSNEEFGAKWLEQRPDMEAVVFFGPQNEILVKNRAGWNMALATSPYESSLQKCLVYLDDVHTRGSDFRLSPGTCAAVTLGRRMQKDKLVQACMRMRLLGNGHTVSFYASFEVDQQIANFRNDTGRSPQAKHVLAILSWCLANTAQAIAENLPYWAAQGMNRFQKKDAYAKHYSTDAERCDLQSLAASCTEDENWQLQEMYGHARVHRSMPEVVTSMIRRQGRGANSMSIVQRVRFLAESISCPSSMLSEEQERELEAELEEERQVERPPAAKPATPQLSPGLLELATTGYTAESFQSLDEVLKRTSFQTPSWKLVKVQVTSDFIRTVDNVKVLDWYLRPVQWLLKGTSQRVIVSNFEAEAIASIFLMEGHAAKLQLVASCLSAEQKPVDGPLPIEVEVFAGSLYGMEADDMSCLRSFLGLSLPIPRSPSWTALFEQGFIANDGFVKRTDHERVAGVSGKDEVL
ncbi:unnamed protein product [Durusdinium trenchii]|uniref:ubiquitinyl hydrolase 1 n=1 Tax=Durusdinium trenchii TaxID=1381693 RepID=A0ABP0LV60_9DINO